jgi:hypothetical protein
VIVGRHRSIRRPGKRPFRRRPTVGRGSQATASNGAACWRSFAPPSAGTFHDRAWLGKPAGGLCNVLGTKKGSICSAFPKAADAKPTWATAEAPGSLISCRQPCRHQARRVTWVKPTRGADWRSKRVHDFRSCAREERPRFAAPFSESPTRCRQLRLAKSSIASTRRRLSADGSALLGSPLDLVGRAATHPMRTRLGNTRQA